MTMTPERRQEIRTLHKMYSENLALQPQHAVNVLVDCIRDLTIDNDAKDAEIDHLKGEVERLSGVALNIDNMRLDAISRNATLRASLTALVTAANDVLNDVAGDGCYLSVDATWEPVVSGNPLIALARCLNRFKEDAPYGGYVTALAAAKEKVGG